MTKLGRPVGYAVRAPHSSPPLLRTNGPTWEPSSVALRLTDGSGRDQASSSLGIPCLSLPSEAGITEQGIYSWAVMTMAFTQTLGTHTPVLQQQPSAELPPLPLDAFSMEMFAGSADGSLFVSSGASA